VRLPTPDEFRVALGGDGGVEAWSSINSEGRSHDVGRQKTNTAGFGDLLGNLAEWADAAADADNAPVFGGSYLDDPGALVKVPVESRLKSDRARHVGLRILVEM
jgi:formylglycine-generating enzyme required for sulfatase activity